MNDQASNPGEYLPTETAGASVLRRKAPTLTFCALLLAGLIALTMQTLQIFDLRRDNASLRAATASLDQLRQDNAELDRLRAAARQAEGARKEQEELEKLRAEVDQLRTAAQELPALRAESQRLASERAEAAARAGVATEVDPFAESKQRAERIACISHIKQIGLAARMWANDNKEIMPIDFLSMSNELSSPKILTCPADTARRQAANWLRFDGNSVSYELLSPGVPEGDASVVYVRCPIHHNVGLLDGSALQLDPAIHRIEKVDGKFKIVRVNAQP